VLQVLPGSEACMAQVDCGALKAAIAAAFNGSLHHHHHHQQQQARM
jgi:hypothetical protein